MISENQRPVGSNFKARSEPAQILEGIELHNKNVIVTGGYSGIGLETTRALKNCGANVVVPARRRDIASKALEGIIASENIVEMDLADVSSVQNFVNDYVKEGLSLDLLINNAGGAPLVKALSVSNRFHEAIIDLNLTAPLNVSQRFAKIMMKQKTVSNIINISSVTANRPTPGSAAYGAAKGGLVNLTKTLAVEWAPKIKVNSIVVGYIETENSLVHYGSKKEMNKIAKTIPMKRMGKPSDVANACLFFASNLSEWVTGASLDVHGGGEKPTYLEVAKPK